jgi:hypothetical protein
MSMLLLSLFLLRSRLTAAAPLQNYTSMSNVTAPVWVDPPIGRGTWSILGSCLSTLVLCAWKSLHLNVPAMDESDLTKFLRKVKWVVIALLAPEIVVFVGFAQWVTARDFRRRLRRIYDIKFPTDEKVGFENLPFKHMKSDGSRRILAKAIKSANLICSMRCMLSWVVLLSILATSTTN